MEMAGNTTQRHLDGHKNLLIYPCESQLGTKYSSNALNEYYHFRYSWPVIPSDISIEESYHLLYDEELKTYLNTPERSKFKNCGMIIDNNERKDKYNQLMEGKVINNKNCIESYFISLFDSWQNLNKSGLEQFMVGYCPLIGIETDKIFLDFPDAHIIHVIRNPASGYADTKKRPYPLSLERYCQGYNILNMAAYNYSIKYKDNFHIIRTEDFFYNKRLALEPILNKIGLEWDNSCLYPSFNGKKLDILPPWGQVEKATSEENKQRINELTESEISQIKVECALILKTFYPNGLL